MISTAGFEDDGAMTMSSQKLDLTHLSMSPVTTSSAKSEAIAALVKEEEPDDDIASISSRLSLMVDGPSELAERSSVSSASDVDLTRDSDSDIIFARDEDYICGLDAQRYDPSQRGSRSPETVSTDSSYDVVLVPKKRAAVEVAEAARADPMDPQRYDLSRRSSPFSDIDIIGGSPRENVSNGSDSPKHCLHCDTFKTDETTISSSCEASTNSDLSSSLSSQASIRSESLRSEGTLSWTARRPGTNLQLTDQWQSGDTVTTRVIVRPGPAASLASQIVSGTASPPPRPKSPKSPKQAFRALNCIGQAELFEEHVEQTIAQREQARQGGGVTIFVHEQRRCYSPGEEEREQLWRDAKCNVFFGGDREAFERAYPPGCPRWS